VCKIIVQQGQVLIKTEVPYLQIRNIRISGELQVRQHPLQSSFFRKYLHSTCTEHGCALVSIDSVSAAYLDTKKQRKLKEINGLKVSKFVPRENGP
jgi:hypothetical protein